MKYALVLVVGLSCGYFVGYRDGSTGKLSIVERAVGLVGGRSRGSVGNDIDEQMKQAEDGAKAGTKPPSTNAPR